MVAAGQINSKNRPIEIIPFQGQYSSDKPEYTIWQDYTIATDKIFETALGGYKFKEFEKIGGKTMTIKTYFDKKNNFKIEGLPGYRTIIHENDSYQDVSYISRMDNYGHFYLRDLRKDGMIVSNIEFSKTQARPVMRYDSCGSANGSADKYYNSLLDCEKEGNLGYII